MRARRAHETGIVSDERGVALPEFAIAIFPLIFLFFGLAQVCEDMIFHLLMHHAALVAARCSTVIKGPNLPGTYVSNMNGKEDNGGAQDECTSAALSTLGPLQKNFTGVTVTPSYSGGDPFGDVDVQVDSIFHCGVPLGQRLVCNGGQIEFSFEIKLPHQGAQYALEDGLVNCGGSCAGDPMSGLGTGAAGGALGGFGGGSFGGPPSGGGTFQGGGGGGFAGGGASGSFGP